MNRPTVGILKSLKVFACQVSTISGRAVLSHSQPRLASHSSSFRRWPSLSTNCYLSADVKNMRSTVNLKREAGPVRLASDTLLHINEPFFPSADTIRPVVEPRDPDVSTPEVGELQSDISDSDNNEPDMKNLDVTLKEEVGLGGKARVVRLKSAKRLSRHLSRNGESVPFLANRGRRKSFYVDNDFTNPARQHSFRDDVGHAAAETFLLTRLTFSLLRYLGIGYRWVIKFMALGLYAIFLMPGFVQVGYKYFFYKNVHRSIVYGDQPRNRLDLYVPENANGPYPVVIFVTGGAWIIGYKAWGALLGLQLSDRGIMVCCTDYRNFPQGNISDMVQDITTGIGFIVNNVDEFGGDPERIYIAGQSAGCHLATCAMVEQARIEIGQTEGELAWKVSQFKGYLGISGGYNLCGLVDHFHNRGLYRRIFLSVMEGEEKLRLYSPELAVRSEAFAPAVPLLPPMHLFHGTADKSIPHEASSNFGKALNDVGATAFVKLYPDKTHTDVFLQDPMRGGQDSLFEDFVAVIHADDAEARAEDAKKPRRRRLVPEFLLRWARAVSPF